VRSAATRRLPASAFRAPTYLNAFVGRGKELTELRRLLGKARLLTLAGPGGSGKTRLAAELVRRSARAFPEGMWWVELVPVGEANLVAAAVASTIGVREHGGRSPLDAVAEYLEDRRALVVLDNCEHLIVACAQVADALLRRCSGLRIVATSREILRVTGEQRYPVEPLRIPEGGRFQPFEDLIVYEAVRLFVERAKSADPSFRLSDANAGAVVEICRRLDGLPLAIELAAARMRAAAVEEIAARLADRFEALKEGPRDAPARHRTLRAAMDWSYDLLTVGEQAVLRRLSAFAGSFDLEAATPVCGGPPGFTPREVNDTIETLADRSLVVPRGGAPARYGLLETVREYARERLEAAGEAETVRARHRDYFLALAECAQTRFIRRDQGRWYARIDTELENLVAAEQFSRVRGDANSVCRFAMSMWRFFGRRGYLRTGLEWVERALPLATEAGVRAEIANGAAVLAGGVGNRNVRRRYAGEALRSAEWIGSPVLAATATMLVGLSAEDPAEARSLLLEAIRLAESAGDRFWAGVSKFNLGYVEMGTGNADTARGLFADALALFDEVGDLYFINKTLIALGNLEVRASRHEAALPLLHRAGEISAELGDLDNIAWGLEGLAAIAATRGDADRAARLLGAADALIERMGASHEEFLDRSRQALLTARGLLGEATFDAAWANGRTLGIEDALALARGVRAKTAIEKSAAGLTAREVEILRLMAAGLSNEAIGQNLYLSLHTVKRHVASILRKLDASSRTEAASRARDLGLVGGLPEEQIPRT
jgi:non-specific serine/threonine protein kinase